jgi:prepilin-type N-terminal cleavage/methylation domain-containing protein
VAAAGIDPAGARARRDAGFTLVEVLVAMVILAIGLLGIEAMAIGASRQIAAANLTTEYTLLASQDLESELRRVRQRLPAQTRAYDVPEGPSVSVVSNAQAQPDGGSLWTVAVTVTPRTHTHLRLAPITVTGRALTPNPP